MNKGIYFTSDLHIGHERAIEFDKRPFKNLDHMHRVLINNYNAVVNPYDICYFLGDIGLTKGGELIEIINQLNGIKILIKGNHDKKGHQFYTTQCGFVTILNSASIMVGKTLVTMSHCPLLGIWREDVTGMRGAKKGENWHGESKNGRFSLPDFGQYHLHGHIHSGPHRDDKSTILDRQMDIGVVAHKYRPVSLSQIETWIAKREQKRD